MDRYVCPRCQCDVAANCRYDCKKCRTYFCIPCLYAHKKEGVVCQTKA